MQATSRVLMIRPVNFSFNHETAVNNAFQVSGYEDAAQARALEEFENFTKLLMDNGVDVTVVNDTPDPYTPDSIFPNNWISLHEDGTVCLYPMFAPNRRLERKPAVLEKLAFDYEIRSRIDLSSFEDQQLYLEGTGSMVLDRENKIAYACLSPRTDNKVLEKFCAMMKFRSVEFHAKDRHGKPIYHTNVMMCVADTFVVVALDSITDDTERNRLVQAITQSGKEIIPITLDQMSDFAGNMLMLNNKKGERLMVMSSRAFDALTNEQVEKISDTCRIIHAPLTTIENNGGGSARCMIAEIHLPLKQSS